MRMRDDAAMSTDERGGHDSAQGKLASSEIAQAGLTGWAHLGGSLHTRLRTGRFASGLVILEAIGAAAEEMNHHPDLDLRYTHLDVRLTSHDAGGVTRRDLRLAGRISAIAAEAGVEVDCSDVSRMELALDSPDYPTVLPFWAAVLALSQTPGADDEVRDTAGVLPTVWFQQSGAEEPRQRWHLDIWVDPAQVQPRIDAAVAAGGTLVSDADAPSFWVLADPEGNKVCLCTWQERG